MTWTAKVGEAAKALVGVVFDLIALGTDLLRVLATKLDDAVDELRGKPPVA